MNFHISVYILLFTLFLCDVSSWAAETCSRTAIINYQEVLVDTNSNQKGEGLRYYLEKDNVAKEYLNRYQKGSELRWHHAIPGTLGTGFILGGLFTSGESGRQSLIIAGATLIALNFLIAKTLEVSNEENLERAINEYNKRNLPLIHFNLNKQLENGEQNFSPSILINYEKTF